jgi:hypothetical protein
MHANNFYLEFLDILKIDFKPAGAYASMSQSGFPVVSPVIFLSCNVVVLSNFKFNVDISFIKFA